MEVTRYSDDIIQVQRTHDGIIQQSLMVSIWFLHSVCADHVLLNNDHFLIHFSNSHACKQYIYKIMTS